MIGDVGVATQDVILLLRDFYKQVEKTENS